MYPGFSNRIRDEITGYKMPVIFESYKQAGSPVLNPGNKKGHREWCPFKCSAIY
jgi:hypothetical protein